MVPSFFLACETNEPYQWGMNDGRLSKEGKKKKKEFILQLPRSDTWSDRYGKRMGTKRRVEEERYRKITSKTNQKKKEIVPLFDVEIHNPIKNQFQNDWMVNARKLRRRRLIVLLFCLLIRSWQKKRERKKGGVVHHIE